MPKNPTTELHDLDMARRLYSFRFEFVDKKQKDAAVKLNVSPSYLSAAEKGQRPISLTIVDTLASEFNMNREWLSTGNGDRRTTGPVKATAASSLQTVHTNVLNIMKTIKILEKNLSRAYNMIESQSKTIDALQKRLDKMDDAK